MTNDTIARLPVFLQENRMSYLVIGGEMLDEFYGHAAAPGRLASQAWIASVVQSSLDGKGISKLTPESGGGSFLEYLERCGPHALGQTHYNRYGATPGFLLKLLHSDKRLLAQVHPNAAMAQKYFNSPYGKTEAWYVMETALGKRPVIYAGFKPGVTRQVFRELIESENIPAIMDCFHEFEIHKGDVLLIPAGLPHALGGDCLVAEIQEPVDITLRAERRLPDGGMLPEEKMHLGIGLDGMMDCFNFTAFDHDRTQKRVFIHPKERVVVDGVKELALIDDAATPCFAMTEITLAEGAVYSKRNDTFCVALVLEGRGRLKPRHGASDGKQIKKSDEIFLPYDMGEYQYVAETPLRMLECYPPMKS